MKYSFCADYRIVNGKTTGVTQTDYTITSRAEARALIQKLQPDSHRDNIRAVIDILRDRLKRKGKFLHFTITLNTAAPVQTANAS